MTCCALMAFKADNVTAASPSAPPMQVTSTAGLASRHELTAFTNLRIEASFISPYAPQMRTLRDDRNHTTIGNILYSISLRYAYWILIGYRSRPIPERTFWPMRLARPAAASPYFESAGAPPDQVRV